MQTRILSLLLLLPFLLQAQPENIIGLDTFELRTVRLPMKAFEAGSDITVITAEQIRQLPANTTDELLRFVSGLEGQSRGPFGVQTDLSLRGSTFSQVLVLVDGMRLNDPLTGHFNHAIPVSPAEIARIEVLKGPAAAHYGADAVGGIIHIITKSYAADEQAKAFPGALLCKVRPFDEAPAIEAVLDESYTVWNLALDVNAWREAAWLRLNVHNAFNADYADIIGVPMPGRWVMVGLVVRTP